MRNPWLYNFFTISLKSKFSGDLLLINRNREKVELHFNDGDIQRVSSYSDKFSQEEIINEILTWEDYQWKIKHVYNNGRKTMEISKELIQPLTKIEGVEEVVIYTSRGEVLVSESISDFSVQPDQLSIFATELFKFTKQTMDELHLGITDFYRIETDSHAFIHKCIVVGETGLGVIAKIDSNIGLIMFRMDEIVKKAKE